MARKGKREKNESKSRYFLLGLVLLFIVIAIVTTLTNKTQQKIQAKVENRSIAALVNDESIYYEQLNTQYERVPDQLKDRFTKENLLGQMIDRKLLLQEAAKSNTATSEEEIDQTIEDIKSQLPEGKTLDDVMKSEKITMEELRGEIKQQLLISKFVKEIVVKDVALTENEVSDYVQQTVGNTNLSNTTLDQIKKFLLLQKQKVAYVDFLNKTRENSDIQIFKEGEKYMGMEEAKAPAANATAEAKITISREKEMPKQTLAECLNSKNAALFGTKGCDFTKKQLEILGEDAGKIIFIDCAKEDGTMSDDCKQAGIEVYPTWSIDGKLHQGTYTLAQLKQLSGC